MFLHKAALFTLLFSTPYIYSRAEENDDEDDHYIPDANSNYLIVKVNHDISPVIGASPHKLFHDWARDHGKTYHTETEKVQRMNNWMATDKKIKDHNKKHSKGESTYFMRHNEFSDMTPEEFAAHMNLFSYVNDPLEELKNFMPLAEDGDTYTIVGQIRGKKGRGLRQLQDSVDWVSEGVVTEVKNQQSCGSCWAFAATGGMEAVRAKYIKDNGITDSEMLVNLSEQELVDCATSDTGNYGCAGGWPKNAVTKYVKRRGGICSEADYPYENTDVNGCRVDSMCASGVVPYTAFTGCKYVYSCNKNIRDAELLEAANAESPLILAVIAEPYSNWMSYGGGIFDDTGCGEPSDTAVNHAMLLTGYGDSEDGMFYNFKNSWGAGWGEGGYIKFPRDPALKDHDGPCGMLRYVMQPLL